MVKRGVRGLPRRRAWAEGARELTRDAAAAALALPLRLLFRTVIAAARLMKRARAALGMGANTTALPALE